MVDVGDIGQGHDAELIDDLQTELMTELAEIVFEDQPKPPDAKALMARMKIARDERPAAAKKVVPVKQPEAKVKVKAKAEEATAKMPRLKLDPITGVYTPEA